MVDVGSGETPTKFDAFLASHPATSRAFAGLAVPASFARETYNGLDAFIFVDDANRRRPFRFRIEPAAGVAHLTAAEVARQEPDFLVEELRGRLEQQPVQFRLMAQLAARGDPTNDATQPWPADRRLVDLGTITLTEVPLDSTAAEKGLLFLPTNVTEGIETWTIP